MYIQNICHEKTCFFAYGKKEGTDQLSSNCTADQRFCFRCIDSTAPLISKSEISSLQLSSVVLQQGLCQTWSETTKTGFVVTRLILTLRTAALVTETERLMKNIVFTKSKYNELCCEETCLWGF